ncbi:transient-receptor-potential-like protein [Plakobranchus ocellatus]|uniref:Transient-receptor-potential-like protein n=1 Tax=Plakobranchus ocellatus TaxID=259542 RepID=A0AAV4CN85_9GAST|nr:transient-receptor-potential-like protein [Plakobranchus ocellatus]
MRRLICRYIHHTKKEMRQDGVNADDLLEIKQDISSLRFELREDRKREMVRTTGHMDSLRRDLNQTINRLSPVPPIGSTHLLGTASIHGGLPVPSQAPLSPLHTSSFYNRSGFDIRGGHHVSNTNNLNLLTPPSFDGRSNISVATPSSYDGEVSKQFDHQLHSSLDLECLKADLLTGVRHEIRMALHQALAAGCKHSAQTMSPNCTPNNTSAISLPPQSADLYHTHLYTQL